MATLSGSSLTNCLYIPNFISSGTIVVFEQTSAPTSWTKVTTHNNKALRIINGNITNGGSPSFPFSSTLTTRTFSGFTSNNPVNVTAVSNVIAPMTLNLVNPPVTVSPSIAGQASHTHTYTNNAVIQRTPGPFQSMGNVQTTISGQAGSSSPHTHASNVISTSPAGPVAQAHNHDLTQPGVITTHNHPAGPQGPHSHGVSTTVNFAVAYRDVIFASKD